MDGEVGMDFCINDEELSALCGLPHIQQLAYLRGIRPYMDVQTGVVGIKRGISYQSISEQLYVESHQGIKSERFSRTQVRRALPGLERVGLIGLQSKGLKLILKCHLATRGYSVQNKVVTNSSQQVVTFSDIQLIENKYISSDPGSKPDIAKTAKADTPLKDNNYIYLSAAFEKFWSVYPEKKSKQTAWQTFQQLNPDHTLLNQMFQALETHIKHREGSQMRGDWVPPWKHLATWIQKRCWEDEMTVEKTKENQHANRRKTTGNESAKDLFWTEEEQPKNNVIHFQRQPYGKQTN